MSVTEPTPTTARPHRGRRIRGERTTRWPRHDAHATRAFTPTWR
jgi:hypothetical protein